MSNANLRWEWPHKLRAMLPESCDDYVCQFDKLRGGDRDRYQVGDVKRCGRHRRLQYVTKTGFSTDSNGGTTYVHWKRLRPWRLGYWRTRWLLLEEGPR